MFFNPEIYCNICNYYIENYVEKIKKFFKKKRKKNSFYI